VSQAKGPQGINAKRPMRSLIRIGVGIGLILVGGTLAAPAFADTGPSGVNPIPPSQLSADYPNPCATLTSSWSVLSFTGSFTGSLESDVAASSCASGPFLYIYQVSVTGANQQVETLAIPAPTGSLTTEKTMFEPFIFESPTQSPAPTLASGLLGVVNFTFFIPPLTSSATPSTFFGYVSTLPWGDVSASVIDSTTASAEALAPVPAPIPEPSPLMLLASGLLGLVSLGMGRGKRRRGGGTSLPC